MTSPATDPADLMLQRKTHLIWLPSMWPEHERVAWVAAQHGTGPAGRDNPATRWCTRTVKKNKEGYGRYLRWLYDQGLMVDDETVVERLTPERFAAYVSYLKSIFCSASVGVTVGSLTAAAKALAPDADWSWLSLRSNRLKLKAKPSRDKRHAMRHTLELYEFGKRVMDTADPGKRKNIPAALRYQSGLIIALLAARPLRVRNFQAITIGTSLRWDGQRYWLTFSADETKTARPIDEPFPDDLVPYLEAFLRTWRPMLVRQTQKFGGDPMHRRLWVGRNGLPMKENTLRLAIERYTEKQFGTAVWPHLFRDCLLTSLAEDQPDLMAIGAALLAHASSKTGEKHYNQARMVDASRQYGRNILELREALLSSPQPEDEKR